MDTVWWSGNLRRRSTAYRARSSSCHHVCVLVMSGCKNTQTPAVLSKQIFGRKPLTWSGAKSARVCVCVGFPPMVVEKSCRSFREMGKNVIKHPLRDTTTHMTYMPTYYTAHYDYDQPAPPSPFPSHVDLRTSSPSSHRRIMDTEFQ